MLMPLVGYLIIFNGRIKHWLKLIDPLELSTPKEHFLRG